jgi:hypothetical protein
MDPLIIDAITPALMRGLDKRGRNSDREPANRRRPPGAPAKPAEGRQSEERQSEAGQDEGQQDQERSAEELELEPDAPKHVLDDMA